ncbi:MAG: flavodoxin family protein [Pseudomonadota bacterium]
MNIVALNGSRRKNGNTGILIRSILAPARKRGAQIETIHLGDYEIGACTGCEGCSGSWECVIKDDFAGIISMMDEAEGIVLASPTYWYSVTSDMKRFIDRCYSILQYPESRRQWIGKYDGMRKFCVTAAVCEQVEESMMGNTMTLLTDFAGDVGLDVVGSVKAMGFFEAGSIQGDRTLLENAEAVGNRLLKRIDMKN